MATDMKRCMLSLPDDLNAETQTLKKDTFYDKTYAEMYRQLIRLGMQKLAENQGENNNVKPA